MALSAQRVNVAATATALTDTSGETGSQSVAVHNKGTASVDLGGPSVVSGAGFELAPGESITLDLGYQPGAGSVLYGISASGTVRCDVLSVNT